MKKKFGKIWKSMRFAKDQYQTSTSTITHLHQTLSATELATHKLTKKSIPKE